MIVITGATGTIGGEIVRQLAARGEKVRAVTRDPGRADLPPSVEVVRGDYRDADSIAAALAGAEAAFLVGQLGPGYEDLDPALAHAARDAGVRRMVKLSAIGTGEPGLPDFSKRHLPGEQAVRESGAVWTILRPSMFATNTLSWAPAIRAGKPVPNMTGTGGQGVTDPRDIAAVAIEALLSDAHAERIYTLTGPAVLNTHELVAILSTVLHRTIEVADIPLDAMKQHMIDAGMTPEFAELAVVGQTYVRDNGNAVITDDVEKVLGRPPHTYAQWAADHVAAFLTAPLPGARGKHL
ncbi:MULTISPECIES: NAD(P)H-binding protein [unclassified Nocardia]|uniref:NAD(P)H-binding protein n=1 Tax=unclassified Nocardia TaxID=2637762 RepID=UPI001CE44284|nr:MULTISPECIES: NAD(P)H-binding protein [unclassified Nocardia]